jgi:DNA-binding transcriptional MerR regulator
MWIRDLASQTGLSIDTIRFYEKRGLLDETHFTRCENGYRAYNDSALDRLRLIKYGQALGFTLSEMAESIRDWETNVISDGEKEQFFLDKLKEIDARITELEEIRGYVQKKLGILREGGLRLPNRADPMPTR